MNPVSCSSCRYADVESSLIDGQWVVNGNRFCMAEGSTANQPDSWYQLCPKGPLICSEYEREERKESPPTAEDSATRVSIDHEAGINQRRSCRAQPIRPNSGPATGPNRDTDTPQTVIVEGYNPLNSDQVIQWTTVKTITPKNTQM